MVEARGNQSKIERARWINEELRYHVTETEKLYPAYTGWCEPLVLSAVPDTLDLEQLQSENEALMKRATRPVDLVSVPAKSPDPPPPEQQTSPPAVVTETESKAAEAESNALSFGGLLPVPTPDRTLVTVDAPRPRKPGPLYTFPWPCVDVDVDDDGGSGGIAKRTDTQTPTATPLTVCAGTSHLEADDMTRRLATASPFPSLASHLEREPVDTVSASAWPPRLAWLDALGKRQDMEPFLRWMILVVSTGRTYADESVVRGKDDEELWRGIPGGMFGSLSAAEYFDQEEPPPIPSSLGDWFAELTPRYKDCHLVALSPRGAGRTLFYPAGLRGGEWLGLYGGGSREGCDRLNNVHVMEVQNPDNENLEGMLNGHGRHASILSMANDFPGRPNMEFVPVRFGPGRLGPEARRKFTRGGIGIMGILSPDGKLPGKEASVAYGDDYWEGLHANALAPHMPPAGTPVVWHGRVSCNGGSYLALYPGTVTGDGDAHYVDGETCRTGRGMFGAMNPWTGKNGLDLRKPSAGPLRRSVELARLLHAARVWHVSDHQPVFFDSLLKTALNKSGKQLKPKTRPFSRTQRALSLMMSLRGTKPPGSPAPPADVPSKVGQGKKRVRDTDTDPRRATRSDHTDLVHMVDRLSAATTRRVRFKANGGSVSVRVKAIIRTDLLPGLPCWGRAVPRATSHPYSAARLKPEPKRRCTGGLRLSTASSSKKQDTAISLDGRPGA